MAHHFPLSYHPHHAAQMANPEQQHQLPPQSYHHMAPAGYYHDNRMTSNPPPPPPQPPTLVNTGVGVGELGGGGGGGGWMEQSEGGGKFQLKRRRRCGQCKPCQVKENCNKCQYCLKKDILKQACIHRKCIYLKKPVPSSRHEPPIISPPTTIAGGGGKMNSGEGVESGKGVDVGVGAGGGGGGGGRSSSSTSQDASPHKLPSSTPTSTPLPTPPIPSPLNITPTSSTTTTPTHTSIPKPTTTKPVVPVNPLAIAAAAAAVHSAELTSCQVAKTSPFTMPGSNKAMCDPLRTSSAVSVNTMDSMHSCSLSPIERMDSGGSNGITKFSTNKVEVSPLSGGVAVSKGMGEGVMRSNGLPAMNKEVMDPLRSSALDQHHSAMMEAANALHSCRMAYMSGSSMEAGGRMAGHVLAPGAAGSNCGGGFGMGSATIPPSSACAMTKDFAALPQRDQYRTPADQWGSVPYAYSHTSPWPASNMSYSVPPAGGGYYPNTLGSSCQLGMAGPTNHFAAASQPSFPCSVPFTHADFAPHANFQSASMSAAPFYPQPLQIPSTLPNFPSFSQLPSNTGPHGSYSAAANRAPMYPGSFYSSLRSSYEPQIYYVQALSPVSPLSRPHKPLSQCSRSVSCVSAVQVERSLSGKRDKSVGAAPCVSEKPSVVCLSGNHSETIVSVKEKDLSVSGKCDDSVSTALWVSGEQDEVSLYSTASEKCLSTKLEECTAGKQKEASLSDRCVEWNNAAHSGRGKCDEVCLHNETDRFSALQRCNKSHRQSNEVRVKVHTPGTAPCCKKHVCDDNSKSSATSVPSTGQKCDDLGERDGGRTNSDWTTMTKTGKQLSELDSDSNWDSLLQELKEITGRRDCHNSSFDDFKMLTSFRSDECFDCDKSGVSPISDPALTKTGSHSDCVGWRELVLIRSRTIPRKVRMLTSLREVRKLGGSILKKQTHRKGESDLLCHKGSGCRVSPSDCCSPAPPLQHSTNSSALKQSVHDRERGCNCVAHFMDKSCVNKCVGASELNSQSVKDELGYLSEGKALKPIRMISQKVMSSVAVDTLLKDCLSRNSGVQDSSLTDAKGVLVFHSCDKDTKEAASMEVLGKDSDTVCDVGIVNVQSTDCKRGKDDSRQRDSDSQRDGDRKRDSKKGREREGGRDREGERLSERKRCKRERR